MTKNNLNGDSAAHVQTESSTFESLVSETTKLSENNGSSTTNTWANFSLSGLSGTKEQVVAPALPSQQAILNIAAMLGSKQVTANVRVRAKENHLILNIQVSNTEHTAVKKLEVGADTALVSAVIAALDYNTEALASYNVKEHEVEVLADPELTKMQIFSALTKIRKMHVENELTAGDGTIYTPTWFSIRYNRNIHICVKNTGELNNIIMNAIAGN